MTAVVMPFRGGDPQREAALEWTLDRYRTRLPDVDVVFGESPDGPFNRAAAILDGAAKTDAEVLIVSDSDCWTDGLQPALLAVEAGAPWAVPHLKLHRLSEAATGDVLNGAEPHERMSHDDPAYKGFECALVFVARREALEIAPPDPRFVGWGHEEQALALALRTLVGKPWRETKAPVWHLWHPYQPRKSRSTGNDANKTLYQRYKKANGNRDAMAALVSEALSGASASTERSRRP